MAFWTVVFAIGAAQAALLALALWRPRRPAGNLGKAVWHLGTSVLAEVPAWVRSAGKASGSAESYAGPAEECGQGDPPTTPTLEGCARPPFKGPGREAGRTL